MGPARSTVSPVRSLLARLRQLPGARKAGVSTFLGITTPVMLGFLGLAIDTTYWETNKVKMQASTDMAAVAAGRAYKASANITTEAVAVLAANGFTNGVGNVTVAVRQPPTSGTYAGNPNAIEVAVTQPQQTIFSRVLGITPPTLQTSAVAAPPASTGGGACIIALGTTGQTVTINGSNLIDTQFCNFYNNSVASDATRLVGGGTLKVLNAYLTGDWTGSGFLIAGKSIQKGATPVADPYADRGLPVVPNRCDSNSSNHNNSVTYNAKPDGFFVFCKGIKLVANTQTLTLGPGIYVIAGDAFTINSGWTINATNATIYFTKDSNNNYAQLKVNGQNVMNLTPPKTGITRGIAVMMDPNAPTSNGMDFGGSTTLNVTGAIYGANAQVTISGSNGSSGCTQVVARSIVTNGNNTFKHDCGGWGVSDPPGTLPALVLVQ